MSLTYQSNVWKFTSLLVFLLFANSTAQTEIKSLQWGVGNNYGFPVIETLEHQGLKIAFDIKADYEPDLSIVFKFCNRKWQPYPSVFLQAQGKDIYRIQNYKRLPLSVEGADYHFQATFPNKEIVFPFSGRWKFFVTSSYDTSEIYTWGEFFVVNKSIPVTVTANKAREEGRISDNTIFDRTYELRTKITLPLNMHNMYLDGIEIIENRKIAYPVIIDMNDNGDNKLYETNGHDNFTFIWKNLHPGNEYRSVDIRDEDKYPLLKEPQLSYHVETERLYRLGTEDMNGNFILKNFNDYYADYLPVQINLRADFLVNRDVYLVGAFNYWEVLPGYKMLYKDGLYSTVIELKRGKYDYQFVTAPKNEDPGEVNWYEIEGNFWETSNEYHIFVDYNSPELGGYDKIIGYYKFILNGHEKDKNRSYWNRSLR